MKKIELSPKEKEAISNLKVGFNVVKESQDIALLATKRVEISQKWSTKLLKISLYLNILTLILYMIATVFVLLEPTPDYYATTPSGRIVGPLPKYIN